MKFKPVCAILIYQLNAETNMNLMKLGKGYFTYVMAGLAVLGGMTSWYMGYVDQGTALGMIWAGLAVFGIRRAI